MSLKVVSRRQLHAWAQELHGFLLRRSREVFGDSLVSFVVYGSAARGDLHEFSDVDVLVVLEETPPGRWKRYEPWDPIEDEAEALFGRWREQGWHWSISARIKSRSEAEAGSALYLDMIEDGVIGFDKDRFFARYLGALKRRLETAGARKVRAGKEWYWDLNVDPGSPEHVEL
jgi:predicted nucleotidyltransferase